PDSNRSWRKIRGSRHGISKKDASEILNVTPSQFKAIEAEHGLKSVRLGKADVILKGHILKIAAAWVAGAEIQERLRGEGRKMNWQRQISSLGKRSAGWPRAEVHQLFGW
ncbi:hypothetical protein, partial [Segeticoccus rhizosphaerae]|uniref:hypothetical protein n=1 Tax=Segeticoccus rhizosphaerae TaxID=1104777 RepID=UPI00193989E4